MKMPAPSEYQIQSAVTDLLRRCCNPKWRWTHLPLGEYRATTTARRLKRLGTQAGWPDLVFAGPKHVFFLELKKTGGRLSKAQQEIAVHFKHSGIDFAVASSIEEAICHLRQRGIVRNLEVQ